MKSFKVCKKCGNLVEPNVAKCDFCGNFLNPIKEKMPLKVCPECGKLVEYNKKTGYICDVCSCDLNNFIDEYIL